MTTLHLIKSISRSPSRLALLLILLMFACFAFSPTAHAVSPAPDGGYPGGNTAEGQNALFSLTSGGYNTNLAAGAFSSADQQVATVGGTASRHGLNSVSGGANRNAALGFGSSASQQVFTGGQ